MRILLPLLTFFLAGSAQGSLTGTPGRLAPETASLPAGAGALSIPRPNLSAMEEVAQQKVRAAQTTLEQLSRQDGVSAVDLAEGFGFLGRLYHAFKLLDAAEECYRHSRTLAPADYRFAYYLGLVHFAQGELERAVADFEIALELRSADLPSLLRLGDALLELNRHTEAQVAFDTSLQIESSSAAAFYGLGRAATLAGEDQAAVEAFERALSLQPEASVIRYPLGQAYRRLGDMAKAMEHLRQRGQQNVRFSDPLGSRVSRLAKSTSFEIVLALARDHESFSEKEFLGFALSQFADVKGTIEQLQAEMERRGETGAWADSIERARIHFVLGGLLVNDQRDEEAIEHFRRAIELDPDLKDARIKLGNALARNNRLEEAVIEYSAVLEADNDEPDALLKRASALMLLERDDEAKDDLERLVQLSPENVEGQLRLATTLELLQDHEAAIARYRTAARLELAPRERLQARVRLARLLRQRGSLEGALAEYRGALEIDPQHVPALAGLASLLAGLNRFGEAADLYRAWATAEPGEPQPRLAEATALIFAGRYGEATERLEEAVGLFPTILDFKDILGRHLAACPDRDERDGTRALELALAVYQQLPSPQSTETVAMAYAEAGRFDEAAIWQRRMLTMVKEEGDTAEEGRLRRNLALYERGEACCAALEN